MSLPTLGKITESLGTKDPDRAREVRNQRIVYWDRQFKMLREGPSEDDLREEAVEVFRRAQKVAVEKRQALIAGGWYRAEPLSDQEVYATNLDFNSVQCSLPDTIFVAFDNF